MPAPWPSIDDVRNSLLPVVVAIALIAVGLVLIRPTVDRGQGGPEVNAGILRLPKRDPIRTRSMELSGSSAATLEAGSRDDGQWRIVVVASSDREPATRATMLAIGEALYAAGCLVVMDPASASADPTPPLPLPSDRILRVSTRSMSGSQSRDGTWTASIEVRCWEPRLPAGHPVDGLQPAGIGATSVCRIEHTGTPASGASGGWPERWAATGRAIAQAALGALAPAGVKAPKEAASPDWGSQMPSAPWTPELHWDGCFQHDFVRGWSGGINGRTVTTQTGTSEPAIAPLERLLVSGRWEPLEPSAGWRLWSRAKDGARQWFAVTEAPTGWTTTMWVERPAPADVVAAWSAAAAAGDQAARVHLRRAAAIRALPEDLRQRAAAAAR